MNIVDRLTNRGSQTPEESQEAKMRRDVLFTQLRLAHPDLAPENIDLSEVDFTISDNDLRLQVAKWRGITSETAISEIDLDEVISFSGEQRRRVRRTFDRARAKKLRKGQHAFRRQQHLKRIKTVSKPSGHEKVVAQRARKAAATVAAAAGVTGEAQVGKVSS